MKKIKTIEAVNAYNTLKELKLNSMNDESMMNVWKSMKALRPVADTYNKDVEEAQTTLKDDKLEEMQKKLQQARENERKAKTEDYQYTEEDITLLNEVNDFFTAYKKKTEKYFQDLAEAEVEVEIEGIETSELLKALKTCEKNFESMETLLCICK